MAISKEDKLRFAEASKDDKTNLTKYEKSLKEISDKRKKHQSIAGYYSLELADIYLKMIPIYLHISDLSNDIMGIKDSASQEKARKTYSNMLIVLEDIVGGDFDRPLAENKDYLQKIEKFNIRQTLELCKKMIFVYETLVDNFGSDSKHKWHFVDNHAKIANVIKNMVNFATIEQFRNFRSEFYRDREDLLDLCKRTLEDAAKNVRSKYELSTQAPEDIKKAIWLLTSLRQINVIYGESEEAERNKTVIDALRQRFEQEEKKKEEAKKKR